MKKINDYIEDHDLCVIACVESFGTRKGEQYLSLWFDFEKYFETIRVPVLLLTRDPNEQCDKMMMLYSSFLFFMHDTNDEFFRENQLVKKKWVFGEEKEIVYPYIFLFVNGELYKTIKRMNEKSIANLYVKVLEIRYKNFLKKFKNMFDIP